MRMGDENEIGTDHNGQSLLSILCLILRAMGSHWRMLNNGLSYLRFVFKTSLGPSVEDRMERSKR